MLVQRFRDQRRLLLLLPDTLTQFAAVAQSITEAPDSKAAWQEIQKADALLAHAVEVLPEDEKRHLLPEIETIRLIARSNDQSLPPLPELGGPAIHAFAVFEGLVERSRL